MEFTMCPLALLAVLAIPFVAIAEECVNYDDYYPDSGPIIGHVGEVSNGSVVYSDGYAFVGSNSQVVVIDVSNPSDPGVVAQVSVGGSSRNIVLNGSILYVPCDYYGLDVIDVSDPLSPTVLSSTPTSGRPHDVTVQSGIAYVAIANAGVCVIDVTDPTTPVLLDEHDVPSEVFGIAVTGQYVFLAASGGGIYIVDAVDPNSLVDAGYLHAGDDIVLHGIRIIDNLAYVANYGYWPASDTGSLQIYSLEEPTNPALIGEVFTGGSAWSVSVNGRYAYVSDKYESLIVVDVSDPQAPEVLGWSDIGSTQYTYAFSEEHVYGCSGSGFYITPIQCDPGYIVDPYETGDFPTIQDAIDWVTVGSTVLLANGEYLGAGNRDLDLGGKWITIASQSGNPDSCIIDCQGTESEPHRGFLFHSGESFESVIEGITIMGSYTDEGGAIKCENGSSPTIRNCILRDNFATSGGAIYCENSSPVIENCTISFNESSIAGAAFLLYSNPTFENCILSHSIEGAAVFGYESNPLLTCTDVVWNEGGDWVGCIAEQQNQNGNFSNTPAFCNPESGDFRLQPGSPCLPEHNECGVIVGALGEGDCAPTGAEEVPVPDRVLLSAFPNPFNPHLTITLSLPVQAQGTLIVHDVSGRRVRLLKKDAFAHGIDEIVWNGKDDQGQDVASGVYFVQLVTDEYKESKKVVLLR